MISIWRRSYLKSTVGQTALSPWFTRLGAFVGVLGGVFLAFSAPAYSVPAEEQLSEMPSVIRDVSLIQNRQFTRPHIPPYRTTKDGRVAMQTRTRSTNATAKVFDFYLFTPERISQSFIDSPDSARILSNTTPLSLGRNRFIDSTDQGESFHSAFCEVETDNPKVCGASGTNDCYEFKVITPFHNTTRNRMEFWSTIVTVEVANPKTANARIADIRTRNSRRGTSWDGVNSMLETMIAGDGRLLIGRIGNNTITWTDERGNRRTSQPNVIYSHIPNNLDACDVTALSNPYPITHAYYHPPMRNRFGFAKYPMRDGTGALLQDGVDFGGSYPWVDSHGKNLFFGTFRASVKPDGNPEYRMRCVGGGDNCNNPTEELTKDTMGVAVSGLWTGGKVVLLDNMLNNIDWNLEASNSGQVELKLYQGNNGWIHVGAGRDNGATSYMPPGGSGNINFVDSVENKLNYDRHMKPNIPRDVTWIVSSGKATDFVAFDDWINPQMFISSEMVQVIAGQDLEPNNSRFQNAASTQLYDVPRFGQLMGPGRVEPVALGGIRGKGYYSRGNSGIRYSVPDNQPTSLNQPWYVGFFIDPRFANDEQFRRLVEFPDGSGIDLLGRNRIAYTTRNGQRDRINLNQTLSNNQYYHLGFRIRPNGRTELFLDGNLINVWNNPSNWNIFGMQAGDFWLGTASNQSGGFVGWMDELKVVADADNINVEEFCNYASGSIVSVSALAPQSIKALANALPSDAKNLIDQALPNNKRQSSYLCYKENRSADGWVDLNRLPIGINSLRKDLLFPEGPLVADSPRPNSSDNAFCGSCHQNDRSGNRTDSLLLAALQPNGTAAKRDDRRQPSQPPARMYGNIPSNFFGLGLPSQHIYADQGIFVDEYILPGSIPNNDGGSDGGGDSDNTETSNLVVSLNGKDGKLEKTPGQPSLINFTVRVDNEGSKAAQNVEVKIELPEAVNLVSLASDSGTCTKNTVSCDLGNIGSGQRAKVDVQVSTENNVKMMFSASATTTSTESKTSDNSASALFGGALSWLLPLIVLLLSRINLHPLRGKKTLLAN